MIHQLIMCILIFNELIYIVINHYMLINVMKLIISKMLNSCMLPWFDSITIKTIIKNSIKIICLLLLLAPTLNKLNKY